MATDISVTINPPAQFDLNLQPPNEIDLTISEGLPKHAETHAPGGSDSLSAYYVTGSVVRPSETGQFVGTGQTGFYTGVFYPYSSNPNGYVQGAVVRPSNTGAFLDTGSSQTINSLKNFLVRPTVNGTGVLLSGESPGTTNTGSLTGAFYPLNSNPSGYITGVDLTNYVTKSSTGVFVTTGQTGNFITTSQTGQFVTTGQTGAFVVSSQTGAFLTTGAADGRYALQSATGIFVTTGQTGSFITTSQTGQFVGTGSTGSFVTGSVVRPSETGVFVTTSQTGVFITSSQTGQFVSTGSTGSFVTGSVVRPSETGNFITTFQTGQFVSTGSTGNFVTGSVVRPSETGSFITSSQTGQFVSTGATGSFVTGSVVRPSETGAFVTTGATGNFITSSQTGQFVSTGATGSFVTGSVVRPSETGNFITSSQTGQFVSTGATGSFVVSSQTGAFLTTGAADSRYALQSATGAFVTTGQTGQFVTGSVVRPSETGIFITTGQTGSFITASQTGAFYPNSNPSGFITGVDLSSYATTSYVTGVSGYLQYQISNFSGSSSTGSYVSLTGNETISGIKNFISRPTVNTTGVLISGDAVDTIHLYGKNDESFTLNKGQPVYIGGANGANPLIKRASNTGERTSSKTIGLLAQNLNSNDFGYIVSEGILEGFNTSAATAGDPMWLGTTGNIIFGTGNKPYGNNHLVYLGVVLRSQSNNGKVYVKPQNGFEIEELHRVYAQNASTNDTLMYNSGSGSWFARQINTGDVSGISAYALAANTGSFITVSQTGAFAASALTGAFLTTGAADGRYYGLSNGQSISGYAITGFNDAITGMTITGDTTKVITLFQRGGSTVTGSFTDNAGTGGGSSQYVQEIYIDAGAMLTGISGASPSSISVSNSGIAYDCFNFDASTSGYAQFKLKLPDYNLGNLKARFDWTTSGASGAVVWGIQGVAIGDGDSLSTEWGSPQEIADSFVTGTGVHVTSSTSEITLAGSPQANDLLFFRVYRDTFDAGDTLAVNASLLGLKLQYTGIQIQSW
jgi:DNA-directed RNA polymerase subunit E'/Rpb7